MKNKPPFAGRKIGDRCTKEIKPPFHPKGKSVKVYRTSSKKLKAQEGMK
jgi:hypothetical protein